MVDLPFILEDFADENETVPKVRTKPGNFTLYASYRNIASKIYNIKFRPGDIVVVTTPKAGTHWATEMIWNIANNVDFDAAKTTLFKRAPMLELDHINASVTEELKKKKEAGEKLLPIEETAIQLDSVSDFEKLPSPRVCYTHLPFALLPPNTLEICKVVFITRNPADVFCSYHPFMSTSPEFNVEFDVFFKMFLDGTALFTPYWLNVKEAWKIRDHPNMLFLLYEEMKEDLRGCIEKASKHVQHSLTEAQIDKLVDHLSFENMKNNSAVNMSYSAGSAFMEKDKNLCRKGQVGDFKNTLTEDQKKQMKEWCDANRSDCDIKFPVFDL